MRIEDYAMIGDRHTAALVGYDGSVDWMCVPRFDSDACFAALLGDERHGRWRVAPAGSDRCSRRSYRGDTLVLETVWETAAGAVRVIDFMPERVQAPDIVRIVEGVSGRVTVESRLRLRFGYGQVTPWFRRVEDAIVGVCGPDAVTLRSPVGHERHDSELLASFTVTAGERVPMVLTWSESYGEAPRRVDAFAALDETERFWAEWLRTCTYEGEWRDAVVRSLITLKSLTYAPAGSIVAAPTTSLPETLGGVRNWDYRYSWLRDSTFSLQALLWTGYVAEAKAWRDWLLRTLAGQPEHLQIVYSATGDRRLPELELDWLPGYEGSAPVRIGNGAAKQFQLDVFGEVLDCLALAREHGLETEGHAWRMQCRLIEHLETVWREPDSGLWEVRGDVRHHVHSKLLAWAGFDQMVRASERFGLAGDVDRWRATRDDIHREVCARGWNDDKQAFTMAYGVEALDAAVLLMPMLGFLPPGDPRIASTVDAIERELVVGGFARRYDIDATGAADGLPGREGAFLPCTLWLADVNHLIGRRKRARELFERVLDIRNDVGLLAEEYDVDARRLVGNFPQAFSHVPVVNTARMLSEDRAHHPRSGTARGQGHRLDSTR